MVLIKGDKPDLRTEVMVIEDFNPVLRKKAYKMASRLETMRGYALAANQVGLDMNLFVMDVGLIEGKKRNRRMLFACNPEILKFSDETDDYDESCLSFPNKFVVVNRPVEIILKYQGLDGIANKLYASGLIARVIQHECDHLNGKLIVDYGSLQDHS